MATKTTGAEFMRFYSDNANWPQDMWHEDETVTVNGEEVPEYDAKNVPDDAKVVIEGGVVFRDAQGRDEAGSFESHFKKWRKAQNTAFLTVECPKDKLEAVKEAIRAAGGKVA